jgi:hypothetical protein
MAPSQSALDELLEAIRAGDGTDTLREAMRLVLQELIEAEGEPDHRRRPLRAQRGRVTHRNGSRSRLLSTKAGDVELHIPVNKRSSAVPTSWASSATRPRSPASRAPCSSNSMTSGRWPVGATCPRARWPSLTAWPMMMGRRRWTEREPCCWRPDPTHHDRRDPQRRVVSGTPISAGVGRRSDADDRHSRSPAWIRVPAPVLNDTIQVGPEEGRCDLADSLRQRPIVRDPCWSVPFISR